MEKNATRRRPLPKTNSPNEPIYFAQPQSRPSIAPQKTNPFLLHQPDPPNRTSTVPDCDTLLAKPASRASFKSEENNNGMMRNNLRAILAASAAALVAGSLAFAAAVPAVGSTAPGFTLHSQVGKPVNLKDFTGKWVVLYFYPKDQTPGCTIEAHNFQEDQAKYTALNAAIVGVSADTVQSHIEFCTKENLTFKTLADPAGSVIDQYGSLNKLEGPAKERFKQDHIAARNTFLIDPQGVIRKVYTGVQPNPHSKEVLADLETMAKK